MQIRETVLATSLDWVKDYNHVKRKHSDGLNAKEI